MIILLLCITIVAKADDIKSESSNSLHYHYYVTESPYVNEENIEEDYQEYNDIGSDLSGKEKLKQFYENNSVEKEYKSFVNKAELTLITVPFSKVVHIFPVQYGESPLNVSFKPLAGNIKLEDGTIFTIKDEDITVAVVDKAKVCFIKRLISNLINIIKGNSEED